MFSLEGSPPALWSRRYRGTSGRKGPRSGGSCKRGLPAHAIKYRYKCKNANTNANTNAITNANTDTNTDTNANTDTNGNTNTNTDTNMNANTSY